VIKSHPGKRPSTRRTLPEIFDLTGATALGGLNALARFVKRLAMVG
jgi:hypothetical protein